MQRRWNSPASRAGGLAILIDEAVTPTRQRLLGQLVKKHPQAKVYRHETFGQANVLAAYAAAFEAGAAPAYDLSKADRLFSLDCDFMGQDSDSRQQCDRSVHVEAQGGCAGGRREDEPPLRRGSPVHSHWRHGGSPRARSHQPALKTAVALAKEIATLTNDAGLKAAAEAVKLAGSYSGHARTDKADFYGTFLKEAAKDLVEKKGASVVLAGSQQDAAVHLLVIAINQALGAFGTVVQVKKKPALLLLERWRNSPLLPLASKSTRSS